MELYRFLPSEWSKPIKKVPEIKIWSQNINGRSKEKTRVITAEAIERKIDIVMLQETKMKQEEEAEFKSEYIHREYLVETDNLNAEERTRKRDENSMSRYQSHAPQENIAGSEGLLFP